MKKKDKTKKTVPSFNYATWVFKNIVIGVVTCFAVQYLIDKHPTYNWAYHTLMKGNYETIRKYRNLTLDQKWEAKLGYTFAYWRYLRDNTPEDAVILYPTHDIFFPTGEKSPFTGEPASKIQALRFLYPRKLVYHNEIETNRYGKQLTHVAIVNGWGYEYLKYDVADKVDHAVLPINK